VQAQAPRQPEAGGPQATFQSNVGYVDVDVVVTDEQGTAVTDLTINDFELFEDGKPQTIEAFSYIDITSPQRRQDFLGLDNSPIVSDVHSNREPISGRMYVIVLDDLDISPLRTAEAKQAARQFIEQYFTDRDLAAVVHTSGRAGTSGASDASQDFTSNRQLLLAAIDKFMGRRLRSQELEKVDEYEKEQIAKALGIPAFPKNVGSGGHPGVNLSDAERGQRALAVLETLKSVTEFLSGVRGRRKALVMFSEGIDYVEDDPFAMRMVTDVVRATREVIDMAARSNVNFYTIDPRGLPGLSGFVGMRGSGMPESQTPVKLLEELQKSQDSLRTLAEQTGGFAALTSNSFASAFERIVDHNSRYYMLGYAPLEHPRDGRFHKIEVRVRRSGVRAVARKGYSIPRPTGSDERVEREAARRNMVDGKLGSLELRRALDTPLPQSGGLDLSVHAAPFKNTNTEATVALAIEVHGERLASLPKSSDATSHTLELSFFAVNASGQPGTGTRTEFSLNRLTTEMRERIARHGVRFNPRMSLAPGRYQLRIGARESIGGTIGSVVYDLVVPDFAKETLAMSGLLVTTASTQQTPTAERDAVVAKLLPGAVTSRREFPSGDKLALYAELYGNNPSQDRRDIDVALLLISEAGEELFNSNNTIVSEGRQAGRWDIAGDIPLEDVDPGRYVLRVEARVRGSNVNPIIRQTLLTVIP
jgi:VWFA-related protein